MAVGSKFLFYLRLETAEKEVLPGAVAELTGED
jgi:hypothetical protein